MPETLDISTDDCIVEQDGPVVIITMNRPEKKNALSPTMLVGLADAYSYVDDTVEVRAAILTGAGGSFSSGMDLVAVNQPRSEYVERRMSEEPNLHWKGLLRDYRCTKPMIAAVEGYAVAGGTEMLQGTDIRIAGEGAIFGVWEAKRGLFPLGGSACRLPRQIPYTGAMDILLSARPVTSEEALRVAHALGDRLRGVRLDTPRERGRVTVDLVKEVRARLDQAGFPKVGIFVSGGLDVARIAEFVAAVNGALASRHHLERLAALSHSEDALSAALGLVRSEVSVLSRTT